MALPPFLLKDPEETRVASHHVGATCGPVPWVGQACTAPTAGPRKPHRSELRITGNPFRGPHAAAGTTECRRYPHEGGSYTRCWRTYPTVHPSYFGRFLDVYAQTGGWTMVPGNDYWGQTQARVEPW